ncbi:Centrosomal protein [Nymphon striatum]|nr:Centrosomal protein [Nymphon striatum]
MSETLISRHYNAVIKMNTKRLSEKQIAKECIRIVNRLIEKSNLPTPRVCDLSEINSELIQSLFSSLFKVDIPGIISSPKTSEENAHNVQAIIDSLSLDIINISLSHITGEDVVNGNIHACHNLLEAFEGCIEFLLKPNYDLNQATAEIYGDLTSNRSDYNNEYKPHRSNQKISSLSSIPPLQASIDLKASRTIARSSDFKHIGYEKPNRKIVNSEGHVEPPKIDYFRGTVTHHLYHHHSRCKSQFEKSKINLIEKKCGSGKSFKTRPRLRSKSVDDLSERSFLAKATEKQNLFRYSKISIDEPAKQHSSSIMLKTNLKHTQNRKYKLKKRRALRKVSTPVRKYLVKSKSSQRRPVMRKLCCKKPGVSPTTSSRFLGTNLEPDLIFPDARTSTPDMDRLKVPHQRHISAVVKASCKLPRKKSRLELQFEEARRKQQLQSRIINKELDYIKLDVLASGKIRSGSRLVPKNRHEDEMKTRASEQRKVKSQLRNNKIEFAKVKKYGDEFKSGLKSHTNFQENNNYKILKQIFEENLHKIKEDALKIKKVRKNKETQVLKIQKEKIEHIELFDGSFSARSLSGYDMFRSDGMNLWFQILREMEQEYKKRVEEEVKSLQAINTVKLKDLATFPLYGEMDVIFKS